jgi:hypothetical protein
LNGNRRNYSVLIFPEDRNGVYASGAGDTEHPNLAFQWLQLGVFELELERFGATAQAQLRRKLLILLVGAWGFEPQTLSCQFLNLSRN